MKLIDVKPEERILVKRKPTGKQQNIINYIRQQGGQVTKAEIVDKYGKYYHYNASKHLGTMLSRMVESGMLIRIERGVYRLNE